MILEEATWEEAKAAFANTQLAIIPIGAIESHGPHNPLGTESFIVQELAKRLDERVDSIILPTIPVSYSRGWSEFPGTLWVTPTTLKAYVEEICNCLVEKGIRRIFFLNGHGPNVSIIEEIIQNLESKGVRCAQIDLWRFVGSLSEDLAESAFPMGHSGELPTAMMMALRGDIICRDRMHVTSPKETLSDAFPDVLQYYSSAVTTPFAFVGDPTKATPEKGETILVRCVERLDEFLKQWIDR